MSTDQKKPEKADADKPSSEGKAKKNNLKIDRRILLSRVVHVAFPGLDKVPRFEAISGEMGAQGRVLELRCTNEVNKAVLGEFEGNKSRPGLRGEIKLMTVALLRSTEDPKDPEVFGFFRIPKRFFVHASGPVECRDARKEGMTITVEEGYPGLTMKVAELGMSMREAVALLEEIYAAHFVEKKGRRTFDAKSGHRVTKLDEFTYRATNKKPFNDKGI